MPLSSSMNPRTRAFFFGGLVGVLSIVIDRIAHVVSPSLHALLIPGSFITAPYQGSSPWTKGVLAGLLTFVFNFAIYGGAAVVLVWLVNTASGERP